MAHQSYEDSYADKAFHSASPEMEGSAEEASKSLRAAVLYLGPDGTKKECGDRCMMHLEEGKNKDKCTIHGDVYVPNQASCGFYVRGKAAAPDHPVMKVYTPEETGLIYGKVLCKNCVRANEDASVCVALTDVLQKVCGFEEAEFKIEPMGCCNWNRVPGQKKPGERKSEDFT